MLSSGSRRPSVLLLVSMSDAGGVGSFGVLLFPPGMGGPLMLETGTRPAPPSPLILTGALGCLYPPHLRALSENRWDNSGSVTLSSAVRPPDVARREAVDPVLAAQVIQRRLPGAGPGHGAHALSEQLACLLVVDTPLRRVARVGSLASGRSLQCLLRLLCHRSAVNIASCLGLPKSPQGRLVQAGQSHHVAD